MTIGITGPNGYIASKLSDFIGNAIPIDKSDGESAVKLKNLIKEKDITHIYHLATVYEDPYIYNIDNMISGNYSLGLRLLECCRDTGCKLIYTTSYFADNPESLYALQKKQIEETIRLYFHKYYISAIIVKLYNTWGLDDNRDLFLSRIVRGEVNEGDLVYPEGIVRFTHVNDVAKFLVGIMGKDIWYASLEAPYIELTARELLKYDFRKEERARGKKES